MKYACVCVCMSKLTCFRFWCALSEAPLSSPPEAPAADTHAITSADIETHTNTNTRAAEADVTLDEVKNSNLLVSVTGADTEPLVRTFAHTIHVHMFRQFASYIHTHTHTHTVPLQALLPSAFSTHTHTQSEGEDAGMAVSPQGGAVDGSRQASVEVCVLVCMCVI
jgi:hypothetical protein